MKQLRPILDPGGWLHVHQLGIAGIWLVQRRSLGDLSTEPAGPEMSQEESGVTAVGGLNVKQQLSYLYGSWH